MASDNVFGSGDLTPELLRGATFTERADGAYDAAEVRTFLERVASAFEVYASTDAAMALRAEFRRNAEIAQQVLDAGQTAAAHVTRQAAEEARAILEETQAATAHARQQVEVELAQSRDQVGSMRTALIQDLRDLYDRIGASLYRFERAVDEQQAEPIAEPARADAAPSELGGAVPADPHEAPAAVTDDAAIGQILPTGPQVVETLEQELLDEASAAEAAGAAEAAEAAGVELPEGAQPPAWMQLPSEAYATPVGDEADADAAAAGAPSYAPGVPPAPVSPDPFLVEEDEPLAPGEPLVDLREMHEPAAEPADGGAEVGGVDLGGAWLSEPAVEHTPDAERDDALAEMLIAAEPMQSAQPEPTQPEAAQPLVQQHDAAEPAAPAAAGGSWLDEGNSGAAAWPSAPAAQDPAATSAPVPSPAPAPAPAQEYTGGPAAASPDALETYQLIRDSIASGQSRETVESYLRTHMGIMEPGALVDAALGLHG